MAELYLETTNPQSAPLSREIKEINKNTRGMKVVGEVTGEENKGNRQQAQGDDIATQSDTGGLEQKNNNATMQDHLPPEGSRHSSHSFHCSGKVEEI